MDNIPESAQLYETPRLYTQALLDNLPDDIKQDPRPFFDPCAGLNAMVNVMREQGHAVICRDKYSIPGEHHDFLEEEILEEDYKMIVMNPPFTLTQQFLSRAVQSKKSFSQLMMVDSLCTVASKKALTNVKFDVIFIPNNRPFLRFNKRVNVRPCCWVVVHEHASNKFVYS